MMQNRIEDPAVCSVLGFGLSFVGDCVCHFHFFCSCLRRMKRLSCYPSGNVYTRSNVAGVKSGGFSQRRMRHLTELATIRRIWTRRVFDVITDFRIYSVIFVSRESTVFRMISKIRNPQAISQPIVTYQEKQQNCTNTTTKGHRKSLTFLKNGVNDEWNTPPNLIWLFFVLFSSADSPCLEASPGSDSSLDQRHMTLSYRVSFPPLLWFRTPSTPYYSTA